MKQQHSYLALLFSFVTLVATATDWQVSTTSELVTALSNPTIQPGDTVWVNAGIYKGTFLSTLTGTADKPIIVRNKGRATIHTHGSNGFNIQGKHTWYWGLEFQNDPASSPNSQAITVRISHSEGIKLINCIFHDCDTVGIYSSGSPDATTPLAPLPVNLARNTEVYGCVSWYTGRYRVGDNTYSRGGYFLYYKNDLSYGRYSASNNIVFHHHGNAQGHAYGMQFTGGDSRVDAIDMFRNIVIDNPFVLDGYSMREINMKENIFYGESERRSRSVGSNVVQLGGARGLIDSAVDGNYFLHGVLRIYQNPTWKSFTGNTINGQISGLVPSVYPNNMYALLGTPDVVLNKVFVWPNKYEPGRAHIVVFNWDLKPRVDVDVSSVLTQGSTFELRDALNYYGNPILSGEYSIPLSIPMTGLTTTPITYVSQPSHTAPKFGVFVLQSNPTPIATAIISPAPTLAFFPGQEVIATGIGDGVLAWTVDVLNDGLSWIATGNGPSIKFTVPKTVTNANRIEIQLIGAGGVKVQSHMIVLELPPPIAGLPVYWDETKKQFYVIVSDVRRYLEFKFQ